METANDLMGRVKQNSIDDAIKGILLVTIPTRIHVYIFQVGTFHHLKNDIAQSGTHLHLSEIPLM